MGFRLLKKRYIWNTMGWVLLSFHSQFMSLGQGHVKAQMAFELQRRFCHDQTRLPQTHILFYLIIVMFISTLDQLFHCHIYGWSRNARDLTSRNIFFFVKKA